MKKITLFLLLSLVMVFSAEAHKYRNRNSQITISIQTFYDQLSPYGDWIYTPDNGYVWRPYFDSPEDFRPYSSAGNWVYTAYGWTWVSDYDWGWATFHYGRWDFDNYLGWTWIPGYEWAPAWVSWGSYNNYWGWAPMGPNIYAQTSTNWYAPDPWWTFVPQNQFCSNNWNNYIYDRPVHVTNITHITNVYVNNNNNHNSWYNGPRVSDVERYSRNKVRTMEVYDNQRPENTGVRNDRLNVYRPSVDNKRNESRPSEYRNVEQARSATRIQQTNPRTNNPGVNRSRDNRTETRGTNQVPTQRNGNVNQGSRVEPRSSTQATTPRTSETTRNAQVNSLPVVQNESRTGANTREAKADSRFGSQKSPVSNSSRPSVDPQRQTPNREGKVAVSDRNQSSSVPARTSSTETRQSPSRSTVNETRSRNSSSGNVNRQTPAVQSRGEQMQNTAPVSVSRSATSERQQTQSREVKQAESRKDNESPAQRTSGNPTRR